MKGSEERQAEKVMQGNENQPTQREELGRWKRRTNLTEEWNEIEIRDMKKKVDMNG